MDADSRPEKIFLSVIVPVFNEELALPFFWSELTKVLDSLNMACQVIFVNDGSSDNSQAVLEGLEGPIEILNLVQNRGQMAAIDAGYRAAKGQWIVTMDADLQHPPILIPEMISIAEAEKTDVVLGQIISRADSRITKKFVSRLYYSLAARFLGIPVVPSGGDFRLISSSVADTIRRIPPGDHFWRGLIPSLGFPYSVLPFLPPDRRHGTTKYSLGKMINLATRSLILSGNKSFGLLMVSALLGVTGAIIFLVFSLVTWFSGSTVSGWASTVSLILITSTLQIVLLTATLWTLREIAKTVNRFPPYVVRAEKRSQEGQINAKPKNEES
jgi:glycosyltransferase involved in cell wall biosynthesis